MPKAIRKSVSRSSSRSSGRSSCRKRNSPRDNVLNTVRETARPSSSASQYRALKQTTPPLERSTSNPASRTTSKSQPETSPEKCKTDTKSTISETSATNLITEKPRSFIQHGIRFILLPLHLLHLCVWGSPNPTSSGKPESSTSNLQKTTKKSSSSSSSKKSSRKTLAPSPTPSTSGVSSCSSNFSKNPQIPPKLKPTIPSPAEIVTPALSTSSLSFGKRAPIPRRIFNEETTDYSSDEMVTADEYYDDSSNDRWSSAESSPSMDMSIDFEGFNNVLEKIPPIPSQENCSLEEPMDVSMEESSFNIKQSICNKSPQRNFHLNPLKKISERRSDISSSSGSEDLSRAPEDFSSSSADREIAGIFQRASPSSSSSSDDEDNNSTNGRKNHFLGKSSNIGFLRSCDSTNRKKTSFAFHDPSVGFEKKRSSREENVNRESPSKIRGKPKQIIKNIENVSNQTDSAYSDEDVEMNVINESTINRLQDFTMQSLQESVIEWMDQDLDYVADNEDSNDAFPLPARPKISSQVTNPNSDDIQIDLIPTSVRIEENLKNCIDQMSGEKILTNVQIDSKEVEKTVPKLKKSLENISSTEEMCSNFDRRVKRGPPGFPENPQHPAATMCYCGNSGCFFLPSTMPVVESSSASWCKNYPPAPSPLRHLYYDYPEFMISSKESVGDKKSPYVLVPADFVFS